MRYTTRLRITGITTALTVLMTVGMITQAYANDGIGAGSGGSSGGILTPPPPTTPPTTGGSPSSGSSAPTPYKYFSSSVFRPDFSAGVSVCSPTDGQNQSLITASYKYRYVPNIVGDSNTLNLTTPMLQNNFSFRLPLHGVTMVSRTCHYPPAFRDNIVAAVVSSTATVKIVTPIDTVLKTASDTSAWGRGDHSINSLYNSSTFAAVNVTPSIFGRYQATASTLMQTVTVRHWLTNNQSYPDKIISIGGYYNSNLNGAKGQLTCAGWKYSWDSLNWAWNENDCQPGGPGASTPTYQCQTPAGTTINGQATNSVDIFRDGNRVPLTWSTPGINGNGVSNVNGLSTRLFRSGTPNGTLTGTAEVQLSLPGGGDLLTSPNSGQTRFVTGAQTNWEGRWVWASTSGQPTIITPEWNFSGTWQTSSITIVGVDQDGNWTLRPVTTSVDSTATCTGPPITVSVSRSVNS